MLIGNLPEGVGTYLSGIYIAGMGNNDCQGMLPLGGDSVLQVLLDGQPQSDRVIRIKLTCNGWWPHSDFGLPVGMRGDTAGQRENDN
jgi:hypothetical protein